MKLKIIDNVLSDSLLTSIQEKIEGPEMPWYFVPNDDYMSNDIEQAPLNYSFVHTVCKPKFTSETSYHIETISPLNDMTYSLSLILKDLFELKNPYGVFFQGWKMTTTIATRHRHTPHTDLNASDILIPYKVILFYLNESDGDTYFYDKKHKIIDSITHKENRAVLFDGSILHSSSKPIKFARRIVLNIDLMKEQNDKESESGKKTD